MRSRETLFLRTLLWMLNGKIDFDDKSVTENTRVSYPIDHIEKIVRPVSAAPAAKNVNLPCQQGRVWSASAGIDSDTGADRVLFPVWICSAKLAGTERGITEPTPTFSACFGQAFLELHPTKYAEELVKKMEKLADAKGLPCKYRMERNRQTYLHQRYSWYQLMQS